MSLVGTLSHHRADMYPVRTSSHHRADMSPVGTLITIEHICLLLEH